MSRRSVVKGLASDLTDGTLNSIGERVSRNANVIDSMVTELVRKYCKELDEYIDIINEALLAHQKTPISEFELDTYTLNLPVILYYASDGQESLGIESDIASAIRTDVYNKVRERAMGTIADKDTAADLASQSEAIVAMVRDRAYKKVKLRVEAAYEILNSLKKVMTRRTAEYELTAKDKGESRGH